MGYKLERISLKKLYIYMKVVKFGSYMKQEISKWKSHTRHSMHSEKVFIQPCSLDNNTPNRPVHEKLLILDKN